MSTLRIESQDAGRGVTVVRPAGSIDAHTYRQMQEAMARLLATRASVVVDLSAVDYVSSMGAGVLIHVHAQLEARGGGLIVAAVRPTVMETMRVLGLTQVFAFAPSAAEGVRLLGEATGVIS